MAVVAPTSRTLHSFPISHLPFRLSEADLSRLWQDQTFPPEALTTTDGQRLRVVYRGRRTGGPGPDFRDALIAAPGGLLRGDVELHLRSSDFRHHGHHMDPAYARIVLHLVFRADEPAATLLPGGGRAQVVALAGWVEGRAQEISRWLERPALWREPCLSALARSGAPAVGATLDRLGDIRFRAMTAAFARRLAAEKPEQVLWRALIEALGYGGDHELFRAIADRLPWAPTREDLLALPAAARAPEAYRRLAGAASGLPVAPARPMRPANRPETRLKGAAALAARFAAKGLVDAFVAALDGDGLVSPSEVTETEKEKLEDRKREGTPSRLRVSNFEFRSAQPSHLGSQMIALVAVPRLVGRSRAVELLANAVLPFVAALGPEGRARRAETVYQRLPLPARYGAVRHLHGAAEGVPVDFRRQQGMLYLFKQYCTQGGCGRCPLS